jgi:polyisoprenoid-binding protein YceI
MAAPGFEEHDMDSLTVWELDPAHTTIEFAVKHMMFTTVRGRFKSFSGTVRVDERNPDLSGVDVDIEAASIDTGVADRDAHLRSADFLDVENHPRITFRSTDVEGAHAKDGDRFRITGDLEIRGQAMPVTLEATFEGIGKDPWGKQRSGFAARTEIDRREWGLKWNQALEAGGVLVANSVKIEIEAQAVKHDVAAQQTAGTSESADAGAKV